jgi:UvrB/uvrC motif
MKMDDLNDIRELLDAWPYDSDNDARIVRAKDGREILQVRIPIGLEQLELEGRPDGARPHQMESALDYYRQKLEQAEAAGSAAEFQLDEQDCAELIDEGTLYYFRYLRLFQLHRWADTIRDTSRNLGLFDFIRHHAARDEDREYLERWRPYLVRMNAAASALQLLEQDDARAALQIIRSGREKIETLDDMDDETFQVERERSLAALRDLEKQIAQKQPVSPVERLQRQLRRAIERQDFERAAELRDRIWDLRAKRPEK